MNEVIIVIVDVAEGELGPIVTLEGLRLTDAPEGKPGAEGLIILELTPPG